jgi:UDP-N-acetylglucosamine 2-epimerase (non-hydrolysing)
VTDSISDYFYTTTEIANAQLRRSGVEEERIRFVGNTMIDTLLWSRDRFMAPPIWKEANLSEGAYAVMTLHRPANVDGERKLKDLLAEIARVSRGIPLVFPVHPRTAKNLKDLGEVPAHLHLVEPLSYLEFNFLVSKAKVVITDSGGITEETTVMGIPCMTLRDSTERPETVSIGTNELLGTDPKALEPAMDKLFSGNWKKGGIPELWDGRTAERIVAHLISLN